MVALEKEQRCPPMDAAGGILDVADDVAGLQLSIVNVFFVGPRGAGDRGWVLVDAGLSLSGGRIARAARRLFGPTRPAAIILTHGHFDHVGAVRELARKWDAPVFAHPLELPYLTGRSDYPPPDPTVGGGAMAWMSPLYSRRGIDLGDRVRPLPADGSVPGVAGWRWVPTPGHSPGHVSFFREEGKVLIAGDAFVTTKQESALAVMTGRQEVRNPPAYFTTDWERAKKSVQILAALNPWVAATGHGVPMCGPAMRNQLNALARDFDQFVPSDGRYVRQPARADETGTTYVPPAVGHAGPVVAAACLGAVALGVYFAARRTTRPSSP